MSNRLTSRLVYRLTSAASIRSRQDGGCWIEGVNLPVLGRQEKYAAGILGRAFRREDAVLRGDVEVGRAVTPLLQLVELQPECA